MYTEDVYIITIKRRFFIMMFTMLGLILLGFAGLSAAFLLFVFLFGDKGTFLNLTSTPVISGVTPISTFPYTSTGFAVPASSKLDLELTTMGMIFIYGGTLATLLLAVMMFVAPWSILNKCNVCNVACKAQEGCCPPPPPACGCGV